MEKYVIDLDKVLDELELCDNDETTDHHYGQPYSSSSNAQISPNPLQNYYKFPASSIVNAYDKIDVRDADFSIQTKPPKILNSIAILDSPALLKQRANVRSSTSTSHNNNINNNNNNIIVNNVEAPLSNANHFNESEPVTEPSPLSTNEPDSACTLLDDHSPSEAPGEIAPLPQQPVHLPTTDVVVIENSPAHCRDGCDDGESNDSASVCQPVMEDKVHDEMISSNNSDLNSNVTFDGAITNVDDSTNVHSEEREPSEPQPDPICDIVINNESIVVSSLDTVQPPGNNDDLKEKEEEEEEEIFIDINDSGCSVPFNENSTPVDNFESANCPSQINEEWNNEKALTKEKNVPSNENIVPNTAAEVDELSQLDINNMSEEDLDKFLCDLVLHEGGHPEEHIESDTTNEKVVNLVEGNDEPSTTSQIVESETLNVDSNQLSDNDGHNLPSEVVMTEKEATCSATSTDEAALDMPVDAVSEQCQLTTAVDSILAAEASAIISECSSSSVQVEDVLEESTVLPESSRPRSLTLPQNVTDEMNEPVPEIVAEQPAADPSTSSGDATNRGGLVQNIAYFERQEMPNGLTEEEQMLGKVKPFWIPDDDAQNCLHCDAKFTIIKRRHHCRSCGKVLCSQCCNYKAKLMYLENKEARVCQLCYAVLMRIEEIEKANGHPIDIYQNEEANSSTNNPLTINYPDPNNPADYCSTISPFDQASEAQTRPPPTVMVPVGVLKRPGSSGFRRGGNSSGESSLNDRPPEAQQMPVKQVIFSDGVRPGGDLVESPSTSRLPEERPVGRTQLQLKSPPVEKPFLPIEQPTTTKRVKPSRVVVADTNSANLPPILNYNELKAIDSTLPSKPTYSQLLYCLRSKHLPAITFGLTKNLFVSAKLVSKLCCNSVECWTFASRGLATVGQDEVFFCLDCNSFNRPSTSNEDVGKGGNPSSSDDEVLDFPRDIFRLFTAIFDSASKASLHTELSHVFFPDGLFGNKENSGFIFIRPSLQCFQNVLLPSPPNLIAILIHKWEIPWAKVFPLRLALRLGHEYSIYPTPVISFANRKPAYFEIGHTIMNVLADFRNFQYTLSVVKDLVIHVEERKRVSLQIPKLSYEKVCKVMSTCNEHVLAFGGNFSLKADSHFVCVQNEQDDDVHGQYHTQVAHFEGSPQKVTGASFIVFSGALKSTTGLKAKMNIVEDGLLVQIPPTTMEELRAAIRDMKEFQIDCCKVAESESPEEWVRVNWVNDELSTNLGVRSQIDGLNLEGMQSARIFSSPDYTNERYLIRWIEVFLLQINENSRRSEMLNTSRLAESVSQAFCVALIDFLDQLYDSGLTKIGLRVSLDVDKVGYEAGSAGEQLPPQFTGQLDSALIPAIMENISTTGIEDPLIIELLFYILLK